MPNMLFSLKKSAFLQGTKHCSEAFYGHKSSTLCLSDYVLDPSELLFMVPVLTVENDLNILKHF